VDDAAVPVLNLFLEAVVAAGDGSGDDLDPGDYRRFVAAYLSHLMDSGREAADPADTAGVINAHLALGRVRPEGVHRIRVFTPRRSHEGWDAGGSTLVQVVTDDRPFLVDTVSLELGRRDWTVRRLWHPQLSVARDPDGVLRGLAAGGEGIAESWLSLEVFPPLGHAADDLAPGLLAGLEAALAAVAVAVDDWPAMHARALETAAELAGSGAEDPQVGSAVDLLTWLAEDHFVFLGCRDYEVRDGSFLPVSGSGLGILRAESGGETTFHARPVPGDRTVLVVTKDRRRSPVHRSAYLDYLGVRRFDPAGRLVGERRFLGLLAASAYTESVEHIPVLAAKARALLERSGYERHSYGGRAVWQVIATYPRDELFQADVAELAPLVAAVAALKERPQVRVLPRRSRYGGFWSVLVYLPRERFNTGVRLRIQQILLAELAGESLEYSSLVSESVLARLFYVVKTRDGAEAPEVDAASLERQIERATRTWDDDFTDEVAGLPSQARGVEFGEAYEASFPARVAVADLQVANELDGDDDLRYRLEEPFDADDPAHARLKVFALRPRSLTEVLPHLQALGVEVVDERPYQWDLRGRDLWLYDFGLRLPGGGDAVKQWDPGSRRRFVDAFDASYRGRCEPGPLNALVLSGGLTWTEVTWLRGISRYLQQAGVTFSQPYLAQALLDNVPIAAGLVELFRRAFDPAGGDPESRRPELAALRAELGRAVDAVASLDQDRILRMFLAVIGATVRTNAFGPDSVEAIAYKLRPHDLPLLPEPRPAHEIFVYSPRVHGVHLRFGAVARGGLRWSDRREDFRTEILGLVKAQMVKNTVIVPVGAKGGFVPQRLPDPALDRVAWQAEGIACYRVFVRALLSVTDNLVDGRIVPPPDVVRYDSDDPYLVVAADKGTAALSDVANAIAVERGYWLGDAFASGGSAGYDHKKMGITARGAWESVKRHFTDMGLDPQADDFTCIAIGDMAGDVFGNAMRLSDHIRLVAAFNHAHIFLDPEPDAAASHAERCRLFDLPRSTWADYDPALVSAGGGVYPRTLKAIPVTPQVRRALGIEGGPDRLAPAELIAAILRSPVDLFFNGGIGTYVKASGESHADVGDKANDGVRVDGTDVRARCAVEGGNLGWTQRGRIEYALAGGRINTDFIDNSAGVDTSDHEVNIKILLAGRVAAGELAAAERDPLLASMTDEVAALVLSHNTDQNLALANSMARAPELAGQHEAWLRTLEEQGRLDRTLAALPTSAEMSRRIGEARGLTRPEFATLLAYTKIALKDMVLATDLPEDPYLADRLLSYFPRPLRERFADAMPAHPLARQIITTVAVNRFVNSQGITAYHRLSTETGAGIADVIRAQLAARAIYAVGVSEVSLTRVTGLDAGLVTSLRMELRRMVERATRWLLHNLRVPLDIQAAASRFAPGVALVRPALLDLVTSRQRQAADAAIAGWCERGAPPELAGHLATAALAHWVLPVVDIAQRLGRDPHDVARVHFRLAELLTLDRLVSSIDVLPRQVRWDAMARAVLRDELLATHGDLTAEALLGASGEATPEQVVAGWVAANPAGLARAATLAEIVDGPPDLARMSVGLGVVRGLLRAG